jgi:hypothetical protein
MMKSCFFCLLMALSCLAQTTMEVVRSANSELVLISQITKITFTATDMVVGGPNKSIPVSDIRVILFNDKAGTAAEAESVAPFSFEGITPNPFNPSTGIRFGLIRDSKVRITVIDMSGAKVRELLGKSLKPGFYEVAWDGKDGAGKRAAAGTYVVNLLLNGRTLSKKAVLIK